MKQKDLLQKMKSATPKSTNGKSATTECVSDEDGKESSTSPKAESAEKEISEDETELSASPKAEPAEEEASGESDSGKRSPKRRPLPNRERQAPPQRAPIRRRNQVKRASRR